MSIAGKICEQLKLHHDFEWPGGANNAAIKRTRCGPHQRSAGGWSWYMYAKDNSAVPIIGSSYPAKEVARNGFVVDESNGWDLIPKENA